MIEKIVFHGQIIGMIIRSSFEDRGIHFFTPDSFSQQLAYMQRPSEHVILPHVHKTVSRNVDLTQEVLFIRKGKIRVDFFSPTQEYIGSKVAEKDDVIFLAHGGHGFKILEEVQMIEVKQGPYAGEGDKTRFEAIPEEKVFILEE